MSARLPSGGKLLGAYPLFGVLVLLTAGIVIAGYSSYGHYKQGLRVEVGRQLSAVADLKVNELVQWRRERLADGTAFATNTVFSGLVRRWVQAPNDAVTGAQLRTWLGSAQVAGDYEGVILVDERGAQRMSVPETAAPVDPHLLRDASEVLRSGRVTLLDFHREMPDGPIHLAILVPILDGLDKRGLGVLVLRIDPAKYLYPLLQRWPTASETAETLLVRRDGGDVLFLNDLRFQRNTALRLHRSLTSANLPAASAALGHVGIAEGVDYRGVAVVAAVRTVPGSPWSLVARIDTAEAYSPLRQRLWQTIAFLGVLSLAAGVGVAFVWRQRELRFARERAAALHESEARLRRFYDSGLLGVIYWNVQGDITDANDKFLDMVGYTRDDLEAGLIDWLHMTPPEFQHLDEAAVVELRATGVQKAPFEKEYIRKDGTRLPIFIAGAMMDEARLAGVAFVLDITERRRAEEVLRASEVRYRRLFESAKDGILILDAETGMIVDVNPFLVELLGFSRETFLGKRVWELGLFEDVRANEAHFAELLTGYVRYDDLALQASDGRRIEVEFVSNAYLVNQDKLIQCNIRDVTERKRAHESHTRLATAVEQAAETIVIADASGSILYANPAFERSTGYSCKEAVGQNPRILKSSRQDAEFYRQMWAVLSQGEVWSGHFVNKRKDGTLFEEDATISPVRDAAGKIVNYVAVKRDVTNEVHLAQQLSQAQKMEAIGRLAGGVAHDFNNALGVILGYTELLMRKADEQQRGKLDQILKAGQHAASLTHQLLAFSRKEIVKPKVLDLNVLMSNLEKMLGRLIGEDIDLAIVPGADLGQVKADPGQLEQVVMNLCVNARDAMHEGGLLRIETANVELDEGYAARHRPMVPPGRYVMLAVSDTGCGMDAETQTRIFEPFFTTKEQGKGTGLGLSMVYGIVKQAGGFVWVYSEPGHGTTFKIYLPGIDDTAVGPAALETPLPSRGWETILLVEDASALREIAREILEEHGYRVIEAAGPNEAIEIAQRHPEPIHLLFTDVVMPGMNGRVLAESLVSARPALRVLYMSGYTDEVITRSGILESGALLLAKPFTARALLERVREALAERGTGDKA